MAGSVGFRGVCVFLLVGLFVGFLSIEVGVVVRSVTVGADTVEVVRFGRRRC